MKILAITGSLRKDSYNKKVLKLMQKLLPDSTSIEIYDLSNLPFFNEDIENEIDYPKAARNFIDALKEAEAYILSSPEYNYSIPPVLKNALDWASREDESPFGNRPVAIVSASPGVLGGARVQYHLRQVCLSLDLNVISHPEVFIGSIHKKLNDAGEIDDKDVEKKLKRLIEKLILKTKNEA